MIVDRKALGTFYWNRKKPVPYAPNESITIDEFYDLIYDYVKPCIEEADASGNFDWYRLIQASVQFERYLEHRVLKYIFTLFALALCDEYKNVYNVGVDLWLDYFITTGLITIYCLGLAFLTPGCDDHRSYSRSKVFGLITTEYDNPVTCWTDNPLLRAVLTGDMMATRVLVKYGMIFHLPKLNTCEYNFAYNELLNLGSGMADLEVKSFTSWPLFRRAIDTHYSSQYQRRRMFSMIRAIHLIVEMWRRNERYLVLVEPLKLAFQTTPEPYITLDELRRFLHLVSDGKRAARVEFLCNRYAECFPGTRLPLRPRSLKHLSRCSVRDSLRRARTLPHGVWCLDIPEHLKHYVLIQEDESTHHICFFDNHATNRNIPEYPLFYGKFECDIEEFYCPSYAFNYNGY